MKLYFKINLFLSFCLILFYQLPNANAQVKLPPKAKLKTIRISDDEYIVRYKNKFTLIEYTFKDSVLNGQYIHKYNNNDDNYWKSNEIGNYKNGLKTGKWIWTKETPKYIESNEIYYENDTLHGKGKNIFIDKTNNNKIYSADIEHYKGKVIIYSSISTSTKHGVIMLLKYFRKTKVIDSAVSLFEKDSIYKIKEIYTDSNNGGLVFTGKKFGWYRNGQIAFIEKYKNFQPIDTSKYYYSDGTLKEEIYFINHRPHGLIKSYYNNGSLHELKYFWNGYLDSFGTVYWPNGQLKRKAEFFLNKLIGEYKEYYVDGKLKRIDLYKFDTIRLCNNNIGNEWDKEGNLVKTFESIGGYCENYYANYYENGDIRKTYNEETRTRNYYYRERMPARQELPDWGDLYWAPNGRRISKNKYYRLFYIPDVEFIGPIELASEIFESDWSEKFKTTNEDYIYDTVQVMPSINLSRSEIVKFLRTYPIIEEWIDSNNKSEIIVELLVKADGKIDNKDIQGYHFQGWDNVKVNLFNVISRLKWNPGSHRGLPVNVKAKFKIPLK